MATSSSTTSSTDTSSGGSATTTDAAKQQPSGLGIYRLAPVDPQLPPFYHSRVPSVLIVAAESAEHARAIASADAHADDAAAWLDEALSSCEPLAVTEPGIVARQVTH